MGWVPRPRPPTPRHFEFWRTIRYTRTATKRSCPAPNPSGRWQQTLCIDIQTCAQFRGGRSARTVNVKMVGKARLGVADDGRTRCIQLCACVGMCAVCRSIQHVPIRVKRLSSGPRHLQPWCSVGSFPETTQGEGAGQQRCCCQQQVA